MLPNRARAVATPRAPSCQRGGRNRPAPPPLHRAAPAYGSSSSGGPLDQTALVEAPERDPPGEDRQPVRHESVAEHGGDGDAGLEADARQPGHYGRFERTEPSWRGGRRGQQRGTEVHRSDLGEADIAVEGG